MTYVCRDCAVLVPLVQSGHKEASLHVRLDSQVSSYFRNKCVTNVGFVKIGGLNTVLGKTSSLSEPSLRRYKRAVSSVVERLVYTERVGGSNPSPPILNLQLRIGSARVSRASDSVSPSQTVQKRTKAATQRSVTAH